MSRHIPNKSSLDATWHKLDARCLRLGDRCPKKAQEEIASAATSLAQSEEYAEREYFLRLSRQHLYAAQRHLARAQTVIEVNVGE